MQGANSSLMALAGLFGPGLFTQAFARSIAPGEGWQLPGAPFLLAAGMLVAAMALAWWVTRQAKAAEVGSSDAQTRHKLSGREPPLSRRLASPR